MELPQVFFLVVIGGVAISVFIFIARYLGTKVLDKFFKDAEALAELKDDMLNEKINRISADMLTLSNSLKHSHDEMMRSKIMMQALNHQIDSFRAEIKTNETLNKKQSEYLIKILKAMQDQIRQQAEKLEYFGKILIRLPEEGERWKK